MDLRLCFRWASFPVRFKLCGCGSLASVLRLQLTLNPRLEPTLRLLINFPSLGGEQARTWERPGS